MSVATQRCSNLDNQSDGSPIVRFLNPDMAVLASLQIALG